MKMKKIFTGLLIMAALFLVVAKAELIAGVFGPVGDLIVAAAVAVLAVVFILFVLLPLLGFIFVGMSLFILLAVLALVISIPFALMHGHRSGLESFTGSEMRSLPPFERIYVAGDINLLVVAGGGHAVALKGGMDDLTGTSTTVKDNLLMIRGGGAGSGVRVAVSAGQLKGFHIEGAGQASLQRLQSETLDIDMAGVAQVEAAGSCRQAVIHLRGAGSLDAHDLKCDNVDIVVDGAGKARIFAAKNLKARINGLGRVTYAGSPGKIERNISGLGSLSPE